MIKYITAICLSVSSAACFPTSAFAENELAACPDYFRFVDFGLAGVDDNLLRGGPVFRTRDQARDPLLSQEGAVCIQASSIFNDGHGHPIPLASKIHYNAALVQDGLKYLSVTRVRGTALQLSEKNAQIHREAAKAPDAQTTIGADFLCVTKAVVSPEIAVSCEVVNPFDSASPFIVYCDKSVCQASFIVLDDDLIIDAAWAKPDGQTLVEAGMQSSETIGTIRDFMSGMTAN